MDAHFFISDLHLGESQRALIDALSELLTELQTIKPASLFILGDFFDAWVGDDDPAPWFEPIRSQLLKLAQQGCKLYFMHGNRDFLVGQVFCESIKATLIQEPFILNLNGEPTALLHGDSLCTQDREYQAFRSMVRSPDWQREFLKKPLDERKAIAQTLRAESSAKSRDKAEDIMDVTPTEVMALLRQLKVKRIIHGHTHRPNLHELTEKNQINHRWVLGDWRSKPLITSYLKADDQGLYLLAGEQSWRQ